MSMGNFKKYLKKVNSQASEWLKTSYSRQRNEQVPKLRNGMFLMCLKYYGTEHTEKKEKSQS